MTDSPKERRFLEAACEIAREAGRAILDVYGRPDFAAPKESAAFWRALEAHEPFDASRTLLIEDSLTVLAAARAYGFTHVIAIRRPDSQLPPRAIEEFAAIDGVFELA